MREFQFDGLVGPTHNYGGLSPGNVASTTHGGEVSNPRAAALEGLRKAKFVRDLGVAQAILPPHARPHLATLRSLGFGGSDEEVLASAARRDPFFVRVASSASSMWTANAATVAPSADTFDGRVHLAVANLQHMFHRSLEAPTTERMLRAIFPESTGAFSVHGPLPGGGQFADEGAANHTRLFTPKGTVHLFGWGRRAWGAHRAPTRHPARQTYEASCALARLLVLDESRCLFAQQHPEGIDAGAFHTDVLCVGNGNFLMLHELAFLDKASVLEALKQILGDELVVYEASSKELPPADAVSAYPFNSQVLTRNDGSMCIVAPEDARENPRAHAFLERVRQSGSPISDVHYINVRQSMHNGGGPACLRLRVVLTEAEAAKLGGNVVLTDDLHDHLVTWVGRHYRDRLTPGDLADPSLAREAMTALDELTQLLRLGALYDFQR